MKNSAVLKERKPPPRTTTNNNKTGMAPETKRTNTSINTRTTMAKTKVETKKTDTLTEEKTWKRRKKEKPLLPRMKSLSRADDIGGTASEHKQKQFYEINQP